MSEKNVFKIPIVEVKKVTSFPRKKGGTGQQIICDNPDGDYTFRYECVDKEEFDFSICEKGKSYIMACEPYLRVENIRRFDGSYMYVSIPSYRLLYVVDNNNNK